MIEEEAALKAEEGEDEEMAGVDGPGAANGEDVKDDDSDAGSEDLEAESSGSEDEEAEEGDGEGEGDEDMEMADDAPETSAANGHPMDSHGEVMVH